MNPREMAKQYLIMAYADAVAAMSTNDTYSICFHCQQEVEKYLKAYLAYHGKQIKRTHDLDILLIECISIDATLDLLKQDVEIFRPYAVDIRYMATKSMADEDCPMVWGISMKIAKAIRGRLPADLLEEVNQEK